MIEDLCKLINGLVGHAGPAPDAVKFLHAHAGLGTSTCGKVLLALPFGWFLCVWWWGCLGQGRKQQDYCNGHQQQRRCSPPAGMQHSNHGCRCLSASRGKKEVQEQGCWSSIAGDEWSIVCVWLGRCQSVSRGFSLLAWGLWSPFWSGPGGSHSDTGSDFSRYNSGVNITFGFKTRASPHPHPQRSHLPLTFANELHFQQRPPPGGACGTVRAKTRVTHQNPREVPAATVDAFTPCKLPLKHAETVRTLAWTLQQLLVVFTSTNALPSEAPRMPLAGRPPARFKTTAAAICAA